MGHLSIIGTGNMGQALAAALNKGKHNIQSLRRIGEDAVIAAVSSSGLRAVEASSLRRARALEALGFLQVTLAAQEKISWGGGSRSSPDINFPDPVVRWFGPDDPREPLIVLLHGRGADEGSILALAGHLPFGPSYAAVRAPIAEGGGYAWFANRGIGRPVADSLADTMLWFRKWLNVAAPDGRSVVLVGFSGGAAFGGGLILADPARFVGAAIMFGTLPFEAGVPTTVDRLAGVRVFVAQGDADQVIPRELLDRTWRYVRDESHAMTTMIRSPRGSRPHAGCGDGTA